jgi:hypothetical protein
MMQMAILVMAMAQARVLIALMCCRCFNEGEKGLTGLGR